MPIDRGLSLTPTDMLKGYLLANITDPEPRRGEPSQRVAALQKLGREEDAGLGCAANMRKQSGSVGVAPSA